jgi:small-conductance mechanosensitive channel
MFDWITYITTFWNDLFVALNNLTNYDMTLSTYSIGSQTVTLLDLLTFLFSLSTVLFVVYITFNFFVKMYKFARGFFS